MFRSHDEPFMSRSSIVPADTSAHAEHRGSSWLALVSAATLSARPEEIRARIDISHEFSAELASLSYRLVVQVYPNHAVVRGLVQDWAEPSASLQRSVTPDELKAGVAVRLLAFADGRRDRHDHNVVIAWVEPGVPNLELDGHAARPGPSCPLARAPVREQPKEARLHLRPAHG